MRKNILSLSILAMCFASCQPEFENEINNSTYSAGEADFSRYVAVGNSLTAGYMDGTVFRSGQQYSFPNILAQQFKIVGGGEFTQPSYDSDTNDVGGMTIGGVRIPGFNNRMVILMSASGSGPVNLSGNSTIDVTNLQAKAYNNMGVPGAKSFHLLAQGYGNISALALGSANPYFIRTATTPNATVLGDAMSLNPTFFTNWIGANDILAYAISGGTGVDQKGNLDPSTYSINDITDPNVFAQVYSTIVNTLTSKGAKGVVATIPSVTSIPYFTTVPYAPLTVDALGGETVVDQLNTQLFGPVKQVLTALGQGDRIQLYSKTTSNPLLIKDESLVDLSTQISAVLQQMGVSAQTATALGQVFGQARHATSSDLFTLTTSSIIGTTSGMSAPFDKLGVTFPLGDQYVLIPQEQQSIAEATDSFNQTIKAVAASKNLAVADMNSIMQQLVNGLRSMDGQIYTADYFKGTANMNTVMFSLDGVHPNARGYAFITNEIIKVINSHYKANIPFVNVASYPGVKIVTSN